MRWSITWRADPRAAAMADRHYNRKTIGAAQFSPPGRCVVLAHALAVWVTISNRPEYVDHAWPGAWVNTLFRNEGAGLSSELITEACAATRWEWGDPPAAGLITFVDRSKVKAKRDPGYCYLRAGFERIGETKGGHGRSPLIVLGLRREKFPPPSRTFGRAAFIAAIRGGADVLKAPFPWFGGKSRAAHLIWRGFGDVPNYVEPFAGSLAVLLRRPHEPKIETVNDLDCYLSNFWRAVQLAPRRVAKYADWPVNEADLHARHRWLVGQVEFREKIRHDPDFFDAKIAGWWVWGICQWIGGGFCADSNWMLNAKRPRGVHTSEEARRPNLHFSNGVHSRANGSTDWEGRGAGGARRARGVQTAQKRLRDLAGSSEWEKRPRLDGAGGVHAQSMQLPSISGLRGASGRGIHGSGASQGPLLDWMRALSDRLRRVRVCCGDWQRVLGRSSTEAIGVTAVLLDPPYSAEAGRDPSLYAVESGTVAKDVREWALAHGDNKKFRIALCGYEGEHDMPARWECVEWKAAGGYAASAGNHENATRERIWFSPHCELVERQGNLFEQPTGRVA